MRFLYAVFVVWLAIALFPDPPAKHQQPTYQEKVWLSKTCKESRWYLEDSDDRTATLACYASGDDEGK